MAKEDENTGAAKPVIPQSLMNLSSALDGLPGANEILKEVGTEAVKEGIIKMSDEKPAGEEKPSGTENPTGEEKPAGDEKPTGKEKPAGEGKPKGNEGAGSEEEVEEEEEEESEEDKKNSLLQAVKPVNNVPNKKEFNLILKTLIR